MRISKIAVVLLVFSVMMFVCLTGTRAEEIKIGYVNLGKTFDEYEKTKESDSSLEKKGEGKQKEREKLVDEIKKLKDEIVLLSNKGKEEKQPIIGEKIEKLQEFDKEVRDELRQERDEMVRDILREIDEVIQDYGKKYGYTAILNDRVLVYGNESIDITQDIIDVLNKDHKKQ